MSKKKVEINLFDWLLTLLGLLSDFLDTRRRRLAGDSFLAFCWDFGPEGTERLCSSRGPSQLNLGCPCLHMLSLRRPGRSGPRIASSAKKISPKRKFLGDPYDWTTGSRDNGNEWRKFRVVPRSYPLRSFVLCFV